MISRRSLAPTWDRYTTCSHPPQPGRTDTLPASIVSRQRTDPLPRERKPILIRLAESLHAPHFDPSSGLKLPDIPAERRVRDAVLLRRTPGQAKFAPRPGLHRHTQETVSRSVGKPLKPIRQQQRIAELDETLFIAVYPRRQPRPERRSGFSSGSTHLVTSRAAVPASFAAGI